MDLPVPLHEPVQNLAADRKMYTRPECSASGPENASLNSCIASSQIFIVKKLSSHQKSSTSRRFLPPSTKPPAGHKQFNTPSNGQPGNRFADLVPLTSSTPFVDNLSSRNPEHENETSFQAPSLSSPSLPSRLRFSSSVSRHRDIIDDDSEYSNESRAAHAIDSPTQGDDDDLSDLQYLENLRPTKSRRSPELEREVNPTASVPRKRRRTSDSENVIEGIIAISSSPSPEHLNASHLSDYDDLCSGLSHSNPPIESGPHADGIEEEVASSPTFSGPATASNKFRMPTAVVFHGPTAPIRPPFKLPQVELSAPQDHSEGSSLPYAFSPSRRRGKKDYVQGGAADTVRSWVLALAEQESSTAKTYTEDFKASEVRNDDHDGRCVLVEDESRRRWLLINETASLAGGGSQTTARKVTVGSTIRIKNSATPNLQLCYSERLETETSDPTKAKEDEWLVGTMWDVVP